MPLLFDRSLLPPTRCEFAVVADTHYMLDPGDRPLEFASRRRQSARAAVALSRAAALETPLVVHLGDLVQEYPETPDFKRALDQALQQLRGCGLQVYHVAGNHDVGDKPDPTMPTHPVDPETLEYYHRRCGPSWYSFDRGDLHFVVLNSQIMNTGLPQEREQQAWVEADLAANTGRRIFLFLHLPPYLWDPAEPHLGHYDNLGQPARAWLLDLARQRQVEAIFAGHVHFSFYDRCGTVQYAVLPSTSFTRPGFGHLFASAPPPEQGRDDAPKLGFYLCRVLEDRTDLHLIRTRGETELDTSSAQLVTRTPAGLAGAPLGLTLLHPLAPAAEVPLAWPSAIRQPVRNDYPFLACLELGASAVRTPWTDLAQPLQRRRLFLLRQEGVQVQAFVPWSTELDLHSWVDAHPDGVDAWELQVPGTPWPADECLNLLRDCGPCTPLALSPVVPGERIPGKQHPRTRVGFRLPELPELDRRLCEADVRLDSVLCRLEGNPWETARALASLPPLRRIDRVDWLLTLPARDQARRALVAAEALFAAALDPRARLFVDPLIDLDRTMDVRYGLLDTLCNPRPAFHVLRCLNTVLHACRDAALTPAELDPEGLRVLQLVSETAVFSLLLPEEKPSAVPPELCAPDLRVYHLRRGTVESPESLRQIRIDGPTLFCASAASPSRAKPLLWPYA